MMRADEGMLMEPLVLFGNLLDGKSVDENFKAYMLIAEAAQFLGVSEGTLRNWERTGKIEVSRHPINRYRLYRRSDLALILAAAGGARRTTLRSGRKPA
jgi:MerR family copper efflux transcriptional regulator